MWISILNYSTAQIEVVDLDEIIDDKYKDLDPYDKVNAWVDDNIDQNQCYYMVSDSEPTIYSHNDQTTIDYPL